jgi:hypothetical protein
MPHRSALQFLLDLFRKIYKLFTFLMLKVIFALNFSRVTLLQLDYATLWPEHPVRDLSEALLKGLLIREYWQWCGASIFMLWNTLWSYVVGLGILRCSLSWDREMRFFCIVVTLFIGCRVKLSSVMTMGDQLGFFWCQCPPAFLQCLCLGGGRREFTTVW